MFLSVEWNVAADVSVGNYVTFDTAEYHRPIESSATPP